MSVPIVGQVGVGVIYLFGLLLDFFNHKLLNLQIIKNKLYLSTITISFGTVFVVLEQTIPIPHIVTGIVMICLAIVFFFSLFKVIGIIATVVEKN